MTTPLKKQRPRILIIFNPTAGRRRQKKLYDVVKHIMAAKWDVTLKPTHEVGDATRLARQAVEDKKYKVIAVAGGDGTINEALQGLEKAKGYDLPLGIIPLGTANVLATELEYPTHSSELASLFTTGKIQACYFGQVQTSTRTHLFSCMTSAGFDAQVVAHVSSPFKKMVGKAAYVYTALKLFCRLNKFKAQPPIDLEIDGIPAEQPVYGVIVCKAKHYGGKFVLARHAGLSDKTFEVITIHKKGRMALLRLALALGFGRVEALPFTATVTANSVTCAAAQDTFGQLPLQTDGDASLNAPCYISLAPHAFKVIK